MMDPSIIGSNIKVLIVDDDPVIRALLSKIITECSEFEVVATAVDAFDARDKIVQLKPDVMTLDIEMPKIDGITFLKKVMSHHPVPTLVISSLAQGGTDAAISAINAGAFDAMPKPVMDRPGALENFKWDLLTRLRGAYLKKIWTEEKPKSKLQNSTSASLPILSQRVIENAIIAIGASTGGTEAIRVVLEGMKPPIPPVVIVQHMPPMFTQVFAMNLNKTLPFEVIQANNGDILKSNRVLIAPGDYHMEVKGGNGRFYVSLNQNAPQHGVRPAVDYLFNSLARLNARRCVVAAVLTGMGRDGCDGAAALRNAGGWIVAQDEKTSVVYGMPKAVIDAGAADAIKPIQSISDALFKKLKML